MSEISQEIDHSIGMRDLAEDMSVSYAGTDEIGDGTAQIRPDDPPVPPVEWAKENLFSSPFNSALTVFATLFIAWAIRSLLGFTLSADRNWAAVATNLRLFIVKAYPQDEQVRIWVSLGVILFLAGLSLGIYRSGGLMPRSRVAKLIRSLGIGVFVAAALAPVSVGSLLPYLIAGAVITIAGHGLLMAMGESGRKNFIPGPYVVFGALGLILISLWTIKWGNYMFTEGESIAEPGRYLPMSSKLPWVIVYAILLGMYAIGRLLAGTTLAKPIRKSLGLVWALSPFVITWLIMRKPEIDWQHVATTDAPMFLGFAVGGGVILYWLTKPGRGEIGQLVAIGLLAFAAATWVFAFFGWPILWPMLQKARISFLLLGLVALAAPNFAGDRKKRLTLAFAWAGAMAILHVMVTLINTGSALVTNESFFYGGFALSLFIAVLTLMVSFPLGILMALARTSKLPIFRVLSTGYIEIIRGVPLITILFFFTLGFSLFLPDGMSVTQVAAVVLGYSLFSAAYLAENIRGGLQSITKGQYEAADAIGLTGVQRTGLIILPQALRASIPPLVGQVIGTFKETSLVSIVGLFDLLRIADKVVPAQTPFLGHKKEGLLFVCFIYWIVSYSMSRYSRSLEKRLGVGTR